MTCIHGEQAHLQLEEERLAFDRLVSAYEEVDCYAFLMHLCFSTISKTEAATVCWLAQVRGDNSNLVAQVMKMERQQTGKGPHLQPSSQAVARIGRNLVLTSMILRP